MTYSKKCVILCKAICFTVRATMFEKNLKVALLLDFYGDILSERNRGVMEQYYYDDLSLAEIAESEGISRQGIRHMIKKCEEELLFLEEKLGLAAQFRELRRTAQSMQEMADLLEGDLADEEARLTLAKSMRLVAASLSEKPLAEVD